MANTYSQIHLHFIFAVRHRVALISPTWKEDLHRYITGIVQCNGHKMLQINSMADHIHMLIGMRPQQAISALVQNIKTESSKWVKANQHIPFAWQEGFGVFSYAKSQVPTVIRYIQNQETHHQKQTFLEEYRAFLDAFEVEWQEPYIFRELE